LSSATITIANASGSAAAGDELYVNGVQNGSVGSGVTASWNASTNTLVLTGIATLAAYDTLLSEISYQDTGIDSSTGSHPARTVTWTVNDGTANLSATSQIAIDRAPVLTVPSANVAASAGQVIAASSLFSATDADGDALSYTLDDNTTAANSGHFVVNGTVMAAGTTFTVTAAQLAQTTFVAGAAGTSDDLFVMATDGQANSNNNFLSEFHVNATSGPIAPATPTIAGFSPDTNVVGDGITDVNHVTLTGTAAANNTVEVFDGTTQIGTATANSSGAWSFATATLADGVHTFTTKAMDASGNVSAASTALKVTVDTVAPAAPKMTSFSPDTNVVGDGITDVNHVTLTGTAEANSTVEVFDGTTQIGTAPADSSGAWSFATATLADGVHTFTTKAMDAAGNVSAASTALKVTVDTVAPAAPKVTSFSPDSNVIGDGITNVNHVTLKGTAVANSTVEVFGGAKQIGTTTANSIGAWSFATGTLVDGTHAITAKTMDVAGNLSTPSAALNVTIDTTAPAAPTVTSFSPDSNVIGDGITNANKITLTGTAEAKGTVKVFDGTTQIGTVTANASGAWTFVTATLTDATHAFTAKAMDAAGNLSVASAALNVTVDTTAPAAPTIAGFSPDSNVVGDGITDVNLITLTGTAVAGSTVEVFDGTGEIGIAIANGAGAWSFATAALADGAHAFTSKAMDAAGNLSVASTTSNVTVDTTAPNAPNVVSDTHASANSLTVSGTAEAGSLVSLYDGATLLGTSHVGVAGTWNFTTGSLSIGSHEFTATSMDTAGNVSSVSGVLEATISPIAPTEILAGAKLELTSASSQAIKFDGSTGTLVLDHSATFTGQIFNLTGNGSPSGSDQIDLRDIWFGLGTKETYTGNASGGILTISDALHHTAHLSLVGDYTQSTFSLSSDGRGGTIVVDPPADSFNFASTPTPVRMPTAPSVTIGDTIDSGFVFHSPADMTSGNSGKFEALESNVNSSLLALANEYQQWADAGHVDQLMNAHVADLHTGNFIVH
jgi:hypothetical protein